MGSQNAVCRILLKTLPTRDKDVRSKRNRITIVCGKPDDAICGGYGSVPDFANNPACMSRIVSYIRERVVEGPIDEISIISHSSVKVYNSQQASMIREISEVSSLFSEKSRKTSTVVCSHSKDCSDGWKALISGIPREDAISSDPIGAYVSILNQKLVLDSKETRGFPCRRVCLELLESLRRLLLNTALVSKFLRLRVQYVEKDRDRIYAHFFQPTTRPTKNLTQRAKESEKYQPAEEYDVGPYKVTIFTSNNGPENLYFVTTLEDKDTTLRRIVSETTAHVKSVPEAKARFHSLDELVRIRYQEALRFTRERFPELPMDIASSIAELSCFESVGIGSIATFLIDDKVEEFFVDKPGASVYLDHREWGRCRTNITPSSPDLSRIETRLRAESGYRLDRMNPSIKTEISTHKFTIRASLDVPPLATDGPHLDIRRQEKNHLSIAALIRNNTLSSEAVAYLYFCILRRRNIIAIGEPGSGKTTMINALDLLSPPHWRKITIEDAIESISQSELGRHQVRLQVEPYEEKRKFRSKGREIISLLHRSPDFIYLGEIQTASHSRAMFHALSAGLTGLQTCHAYSPEEAVVRWVIHHNVAPICLPQIGVIVHAKKLDTTSPSGQKRRVVRICEIKGESKKNGVIDFTHNTVELVDVFRWNPKSDSLMRSKDLYDTPSVNAIKDYEPLTRSGFEEEIASYKSFFEMLVNRNMTSVTEVVEQLDKLSKEIETQRTVVTASLLENNACKSEPR